MLYAERHLCATAEILREQFSSRTTRKTVEYLRRKSTHQDHGRYSKTRFTNGTHTFSRMGGRLRWFCIRISRVRGTKQKQKALLKKIQQLSALRAEKRFPPDMGYHPPHRSPIERCGEHTCHFLDRVCAELIQKGEPAVTGITDSTRHSGIHRYTEAREAPLSARLRQNYPER